MRTPIADAKTRRRWAVGLLLLSVALWIPASDILELVARRDDVLLGRYSVERFLMLALSTPLLWVAAYATWRVPIRELRRWGLRVAAVLLAALSGVIIVELTGRLIRAPRYREQDISKPSQWLSPELAARVRLRQPRRVYEFEFDDLPPTARSYPVVRPGFPTIVGSITTDQRGLRNPTERPRTDILTVGDSFTEGYAIPDGQEWPARLARAQGRSVYNLGVSGTHLGNYLAVLSEIGMALQPRIVIVMVYEGNDFRSLARHSAHSARAQASLAAVRRLIKASPVVLATKRALIHVLGPLGANTSFRGQELLAWMPVGIPSQTAGPYYSFRPRDLLRFAIDEEAFRGSPAWQTSAEVLRELLRLTRSRGTRLIVVLAPSKVHVLLPRLLERISPDQLHAFATLRDDDLPPADELVRILRSGAEARAKVLRGFCQREGIELVSLTEPLRRRLEDGQQVYFTYDQHWTPLAHALVAEQLHRYLEAHPEVIVEASRPL
ncbi:MAG: GDSL-type esterase/lipase family protein [Myxococcota bacterium]